MRHLPQTHILDTLAKVAIDEQLRDASDVPIQVVVHHKSQEDLLGPRQVAILTGLSQTDLYKDQELSALAFKEPYRLRLRWRREDVEAWLNSRPAS